MEAEATQQTATPTNVMDELSGSDESTQSSNIDIRSEQTWRTVLDSLPEDIKGLTNVREHKSLESFAKSYANQLKVIGKARIEAPNDKWTDEDWGNFYNKVGRPESPDGYELPQMEVNPNDVGFTDEDIAAAKKMAHDMGLTKTQARKFIHAMIEREANIQNGLSQQTVQQLEQTKETLNKAFGDKVQQEVKLAKDLFESKADPELRQAFIDQGLVNNPAVIMLLNKLAKDYADPTIKGSSGEFMSNQSRAINEFENLKNDGEFRAQLNSRDPAIRNAAKSRWALAVSAKNQAVLDLKR